MFYVYILYMWPTVWIRSIIIIFNSIYHYQFGMKTCYIYFFLRKKTFSETFWLIFNASFQICKMLFHWVVVNIHLLVFWKYVKKIFRRKPTFSLKSNVIEYYSLIYWFFSLRNPLCPLQVHFQVFLLVSGGHNSVSLGDHCYKSPLCAQIQNFQRKKMVHSIKKTKLRSYSTCL